MGRIITATFGGLVFSGELNETPAARVFEKNLPVYLKMTRWGGEYYGTLFPPLGEFDGGKTLFPEAGTLAWWEPGEALCLFFGSTPASSDERPRAVSEVCALGALKGDLSPLFSLGDPLDVEIDLV